MLQHEGLEKMLPGIKNLKTGVKIYKSFPRYQENVQKMGALAIVITLCANQHR